MVRLSFVTLLLLGVVFFNSQFTYGYRQGGPADIQLRVIKGRVSCIDRIGSKIAIEWLQPNGEYDEITFLITSSTTAVKNNVYVSLLEIAEGDTVIIEYRNDPQSFGPLVARRVSLTAP